MATMNTKKMQWDAKSSYRELAKWIASNHERVSINGRRKFSGVIDKQPDAYIGAMDFNLQSMMYAARGLVGLMDGDPLGLDLLYQAVAAARCELQFTSAYFYLYWPKVTTSSCCNDGSLDLALSLALGCNSEADAIADIMWRALPDGMCSDTFNTRVAPFIFSLYANWKGMPEPKYNVEVLREPIYDRVLEQWNSQDVAAIGHALLQACDFHMERARSGTNYESFEFERSSFNLQPVEIMMVLRLRECSGLEIPELDHPIMNTPVAKLYPTKNVEPDSLLEAALAIELAHVEEMKKQQGAT